MKDELKDLLLEYLGELKYDEEEYRAYVAKLEEVQDKIKAVETLLDIKS